MPWTTTTTTTSTPNTYSRPFSPNEQFLKLINDTGLPLGREVWSITSEATFTLPATIPAAQYETILRTAWILFRFEQPGIATFVDDNDDTTATTTTTTMFYHIPTDNKGTTTTTLNTDTSLRHWLRRTFHAISDTKIKGADLIAYRKPSPYVVCYYLPHESKVVFQTPHWRSDGVGILLMLNVFFGCVARVVARVISDNDNKGGGGGGGGDLTATMIKDIPWGEEVSRLPLSAEEAAGLSDNDTTPEIDAIAQKYTSTMGLSSPNWDNVGLEFKGDATMPPGATRYEAVQLTETESSAIFSAVRTRDISVTAAIHASVAQANFYFARSSGEPGKKTAQQYVSTIRFGLRPYLPQQYSGPLSGSSCFTSGYMHITPRDQTWSQTARTITDIYRKGYSHIMPAHRQYAKMLVDVLKKVPAPKSQTEAPEEKGEKDGDRKTEGNNDVLASSSESPSAPPPPPPSDLDISSVGIVDGFIHPIHTVSSSSSSSNSNSSKSSKNKTNFLNNEANDTPSTHLQLNESDVTCEAAAKAEVTSVSFGVELTGRQSVLFVWTFRGRLNLQLNYNDAYHDAEPMRDVLEFVVQILRRELSV